MVIITHFLCPCLGFIVLSSSRGKTTAMHLINIITNRAGLASSCTTSRVLNSHHQHGRQAQEQEAGAATTSLRPEPGSPVYALPVPSVHSHSTINLPCPLSLSLSQLNHQPRRVQAACRTPSLSKTGLNRMTESTPHLQDEDDYDANIPHDQVRVRH